MKDINATVGLLTYNSEKNLARALESVQDFKEIILADGGSTDDTLAIAQKYGARVIPQSNPGHAIEDFAKERNLLLNAATQPWFIHLDSDEIMTPELAEHVRTVASDPQHPYAAYKIRYLKTNEDASRVYRTYREYYQIRLVRTDIGAHYIRKVHEKMELPQGTLVGQTEAPWYVPLDDGDLSWTPFVRKALVRTRLTALSWRPRGPFDALDKIIIEPTVLIAKSLSKILLVRLAWGREAIPLRYELLRIVYMNILAWRNLCRALGLLRP